MTSFYLPIALATTPMSVTYYSIGSICAPFVKKFLKSNNKSCLMISSITIAIFLCLVAYYINDFTNMYYAHSMSHLFGYCVAIVGIMMTLMLSKFISLSKSKALKYILNYCGINSLIILGFHLTLLQLMSRFYPLSNASIIGYLIANVAIVAVLIVIIEFINRKIPFCIGKNNK